ncbi:MAG: hypothetical protein RLY86_107 [Pseudomonadota bacterium]|jgi:hypothetical protein
MAKLIAIVGEKGGTGKTTVAHLIGHGAGSLPQRIDAAVITTDPQDDPVGGLRRYLPLDGRNLSDLPALLEHLDQQERLLVVLDGAAARPELDKLVQSFADLVILPFGPSFQDFTRVMKDLSRLPAAYALPNRWPTNPQVAARAREWLGQIPADRCLPPLTSMARVDRLLDGCAYRDVATPLSRRAQALVLELLWRIGVHPIELAARADPDPPTVTRNAA